MATRNLLAKLRSRHQPLARALVELFAIGQLGLALQPCEAMAAGEAGHGSHHEGYQEGMKHHSRPDTATRRVRTALPTVPMPVIPA